MRRPRIVVPGIPMHIVQRGNNQQSCFSNEEDYASFLDWLGEYSHLSQSSVHAYVLMPNHFHLLVTPRHKQSICILMKRLGQRYVQYFNRKYKRSGTLWEGRYKSCLVEPGEVLLDCYRYLELHPVWDGLARNPSEYKWSSYGVNGLGNTSDMVIFHQEYHKLGASAAEKISAYQRLIKIDPGHGFAENLRSVTNGNYAFGSVRFKWELRQTLGKVVSPGKVGRPRHNA